MHADVALHGTHPEQRLASTVLASIAVARSCHMCLLERYGMIILWLIRFHATEIFQNCGEVIHLRTHIRAA